MNINPGQEKTHLKGKARKKAHIEFLKEEIRGYRDAIKEAKTGTKDKPRVRFLRTQIDENKEEILKLRKEITE